MSERVKDKAKRQASEKIEVAAEKIMEKQAMNPEQRLTRADLTILLLYHGVERKKHGKNVGEARAKYMKLKEENAPKKAYKKWTAADEEKLNRLMSDEITLEEMDLKREKEIVWEDRKVGCV